MDNIIQINELKDININLYNEIELYNKKIEKIKLQIKENSKNIESLCKHPNDKIERIIEYGERTKHQCIICGYIL